MLRSCLITAILVALLIAYTNAVSTPNAIVAYVPITLTNSQSSAFTSNAQIMVTVNAITYQSYESPNLDNVEFFYSNGTVIPSWLEGNLLNEQQGSNLYSSANIVYWLRITTSNTFLAANSANTIYMGFASSSVNLLSNTLVGEAPQLSSTYGQYDNGANVFSFYTGFEGANVPSGFKNFSNTITFGNEIVFPTSDAGIYYNTLQTSPLVIEDLYTGPTLSGTTAYPETALSYATDISDKSFILGQGYAYIYDDAAGPGKFAIETWSDQGTTRNVVSSASQYSTTNTVYGFVWTPTGDEIGYTDYNPVITTTNTFYTWGDYNAVLSNAAGGNSYTAQWFRGREYSPNGVMASASFSSITYVGPTISLANSITENSISIIAGSPSDNALITATCLTGDSCAIYDSSTGNVVATGTGTATLAYNNLQLGYNVLYANDLTKGTISSAAYVRRVDIEHDLKITLTNTNDYAIPSGAQISISFSGHNYTSFESDTLNNSILYFENGTVAYSWLEGGVTNKIEYARNVLSTSANVFFWFKAPSQYFLPANTGIPTNNVIYIGFGQPGVNIMDGNFTGEAPQLSNNYAQFDNGAKIFNYYLVNPTSTSGFTVSGDSGLSTSAPSGSYFDTVNAFFATDNSDNNYLYNSNPAFSPGNVLTYWFLVPNDALGDYFFMANSIGAGQFSRIDERTSTFPADSGILPTESWNTWAGSGNVQDPSPGTWDKIDVVMLSSTNAVMYDTPTSNTPIGILGSQSTGNIPVNNYGDYFGMNGDSGQSNPVVDYWDAMVVRTYLPGGSLIPSSTYPVSIYNAPTLGALSNTTQNFVQGNNGIITDSGLTGGIKPYYYQWYAAYNVVPTETAQNALEANTLLGVGTLNGEAQSQNAIFVTNSLTVPGNYWFVLSATDTYPTTINSVSSVVDVENAIPSQSTSSGHPNYQTYISDNINSYANSANPVITIIGGSDAGSYYQNQMPIDLISNTFGYNITFACNVTIGNQIYPFAYDVYGIGYGAQCGKEYYSIAPNLEIIYGSAQNLTLFTNNKNITITNTISTNTIITRNATVSSNSSASSEHNNLGKSTPQANTKSIVIVVPASKSYASLCGSAPNYSITYKQMSARFVVNQNANDCDGLNVLNLTSTTSINLRNKTKLIVINVSLNSKNATIHTILNYSCALQPSSIAPYLLRNGTWDEITPFSVNAAACTIAFEVPNDPIIALLENNSSISKPAAVKTIVNKQSDSGYALLIILLIILVLLIILAKKRGRRKDHK